MFETTATKKKDLTKMDVKFELSGSAYWSFSSF